MTTNTLSLKKLEATVKSLAARAARQKTELAATNQLLAEARAQLKAARQPAGG